MGSPGRLRILITGAAGRCPKCGSKDLFATRFRLKEHCPQCHLPLEKEDGWGLGAIPLNYAMTCLFWVLPVALLLVTGVIGLTTALVVAGLGCFIWPILGYRFSKKLWIGVYYAILPGELDHHPDK